MQLVVESPSRLVWEWHRNVDGVRIKADKVVLCNIIQDGVRADCEGYETISYSL